MCIRDRLYSLVMSEDDKGMAKVPGVGKKTDVYKRQELLSAYASGLDRRDMVEPCEAADMMAEALANNLPGCVRAICVRGVTSFTHSLLELLSVVANNGGEMCIRDSARRVEEPG